MLHYTEIKETFTIPMKFFYYVDRITECNRYALLDWFTARDRHGLQIDALAGKALIAVTGTALEIGILTKEFAIHVPKKPIEFTEESPVLSATEDVFVYGVQRIPGKDTSCLLVLLSTSGTIPPFAMSDTFSLTNDMIANYTGETVTTDVGKFLINYLLMAHPFGTLIPYWNRRINPSELDGVVAKLILDKKITRAMYNQYINNGLWYGQDGTISVAAWSYKSLTSDPNITKRRAELLEQYKDQLDDPVIMTKIEHELIEMDKRYLENDTSAPFYAVTKAKSFNDQRKKMYGIFGMSIAFDKNTGSYEWVDKSLSDGWDAASMPVCANDIRRGAYSRGVETAKGGEQTKKLLGIFNDTSISMDDCGTHEGVTVHFTKWNAKHHIDHWTVDGVLLTAENIDTYIGKTVTMRSPQYCQAAPGFCMKCCGERTRQRGVEVIGMDGLVITSTFTSAAMNMMHTSSVTPYEVTDFARFLKS